MRGGLVKTRTYSHSAPLNRLYVRGALVKTRTYSLLGVEHPGAHLSYTSERPPKPKNSRCQQLDTSAMLSVIRSDHTKLHNHAQSRTTADELSTLSCLKLKLEPHTLNPLALAHAFEQPWLYENTYRT
ncbi:hypothetical protein BREU_0263 [Bifidobacterium reuteri DSM 23975]|uniref:Uncharacterized protein n=1 Tax=Bifidobacterium reuteri DSM 23975 TaxID=1437610 RepID=A0A087CVD4_9BIFI|nr:hypothetical protein BREU_0263 [Bifidobacterium reuteri DSM 23975]